MLREVQFSGVAEEGAVLREVQFSGEAEEGFVLREVQFSGEAEEQVADAREDGRVYDFEQFGQLGALNQAPDAADPPPPGSGTAGR